MVLQTFKNKENGKFVCKGKMETLQGVLEIETEANSRKEATLAAIVSLEAAAIGLEEK